MRAATPQSGSTSPTGEVLYLPTRACRGCPYRPNCHPARQRSMDSLGTGHHVSCEFYQAFRGREPAPPPRRSWWRRLLLLGS
jgi:hypothetical protein